MQTQLHIAAMAQLIETNREGKNLYVEGYVYTKIRDGANSLQFWRCQNYKADGNISLKEYLGATKHQTGFIQVL